MGIFKWIMSLFKRKKNRARDYVFSRHINSEGESKTERKHDPSVIELSIHEKEEPQRIIDDKFLQVEEPQMTQPMRRRRRQQVADLVLHGEGQQIGARSFEDDSGSGVIKNELSKDTEAPKTESEETELLREGYRFCLW